MEIDLLIKYPKTKRNLSKRKKDKDIKVREIAREFGKDFLMEIKIWIWRSLLQ